MVRFTYAMGEVDRTRVGGLAAAEFHAAATAAGASQRGNVLQRHAEELRDAPWTNREQRCSCR
jgi:hypothetical protein